MFARKKSDHIALSTRLSRGFPGISYPERTRTEGPCDGYLSARTPEQHNFSDQGVARDLYEGRAREQALSVRRRPPKIDLIESHEERECACQPVRKGPR